MCCSSQQFHAAITSGILVAVPFRPANSTAYAWRMLDSTPFIEHCVDKHVSTLDALLLHQCNSISKLLPIDVDIPALDAVLYDAVDAIGEQFSASCC